MKKRIAASILTVLLSTYVALAAYAISMQGIEQLLICADQGGLKVPLSKQICREYLFAFRGSKEDVDQLQQGIGALFITQGKSTTSERSKLLRFMVDKGLDVNRAGVRQLSPLHGAVVANAADEVQMLLGHGANPSLKDGNLGLTPLEFALKLQSEDKSPGDRASVIAILRNAQPIISPELPRQAAPSR